MLLRQTPLISSAAFRQNPRNPYLFLNLLSRASANPPRWALSASLTRLLTSQYSLERIDGANVEVDPLVAESEVVGGRAKNCEEKKPELVGLTVAIGLPVTLGKLGSHRMSLGDQAFFLLAFIACASSVAFTSFIIAAIPTLIAMKQAAISLARLADTAREELPSTMAAIRLSGMEISDLTLELSDLRQMS